MWQSFFLAAGLYVVLLGVQCLGVSKVTLKLRDPPPPPVEGIFGDTEPKPGPLKVIQPQGWAPWSLISTGAVVCLYSFTLPARVKKG